MSFVLSQDVIAEPYYEVYFKGKKLSDEYKKYITSIEYEESDSEADIVRINVADKDFVFSNMVGLTEKMPISVIMGHKKHFRRMLTGEVTHIEGDFGDDGIPYLIINAIDNTNKMSYTKKTRSWKKVKRSDLVRKIASEYGFKAVVQDTKEVHDQITQDNISDAQFIANMAQDEVFQFYYIQDTNTLYFGERFKGLKVAGSLHYNKKDCSIISFTPSFVEKNKKENVAKEGTTSQNISDSTGNTIKKTPKNTEPPKKSQDASIDATTGAVFVLPKNKEPQTVAEAVNETNDISPSSIIKFNLKGTY